MSGIIYKSEILRGLPPIWPEDLLPYIQTQRKAMSRKIVVLDDDPTGTQTVHGVPVLTTWTVDAIAREFRQSTDVFFILTDSRSLTAEAANDLGRLIGPN